MRNLIKSILKEEYEREPQVGDNLLCHTVTPAFEPYLTVNKTYRVIDVTYFDNRLEVLVIKDDTGINRMFTIKPVMGHSYKTWFHLLDDIDDEYFFGNMSESEEDDFDWVGDIIEKSNMWETLPRNGNYILFYFYPKISSEQFKKYVIPILLEQDIRIESSASRSGMDHLEIHPSTRIQYNNKLVALFGDVEYFDKDEEGFIKHLSEDGSTPINGREFFNIP